MNSNAFDMTGRSALVTGGGRGIGRALALALAGQGADIVLHHHDEEQAAQDTAAHIEAIGRRVTVLAADFSIEGEAGRLGRLALESHGPIDILVANAALEIRKPWQQTDDALLATHVAVNLGSMLALCRTLLPPMCDRGWGRVLTLGSVLAGRPRAETLTYASLKSAQLTALRALARDVASKGVTMNSIAPGAIRTLQNAKRYADESFRQTVTAKIPAAREGVPEDCTGAAILLCSDAGSYITGAEIPIDGGWSIGDAPEHAVDRFR